MAQNNNVQQKDAKAAEKKVAKVDARGTRSKRTLWSVISKKFLLPASILLIAGGLFLAAYNILQIVTPATTYTLSLGLKITSILLGLLMAVSGVLGLLKQKGRTLITLGALSLVYAIIVLTATAKMGSMAVIAGIVAIVLSLFYVFAVDAKYEVGLIRFFREMIGEVKKLTWLSGKELVSYTAAVIAFVLVMALIIYLLDLAFSSGFGAISKINIG